MAGRLRHRDLRALSESIRLLYENCDLDGFPRQVFAAITPLVACEYFAYNEFARDGALRLVHCEPELPASATEFLLAIGPEFSKEHPTVSTSHARERPTVQDHRLHQPTAMAADPALQRVLPAAAL